MLVLGIESSCDETGVALVETRDGGAVPVLRSHALHSQIAMHQAYGGVVPELASRDHIRRVLPLARAVFEEAAGEAFDKSAKLMGLPYPGGPWLARLAEAGDPAAFKLPRPLLHSGDLDFSFAGLKTAVLTQAKKLGDDLEARKADLAASTQAAIVEVLLRKSLAALDRTGLKRLVVAGGVGANAALRAQLNAACAARRVRVHYPELHLCTDNGAMIAMAAAMRLQAGVQAATTGYAFDVRPRWPLDRVADAVA